MGLDVNLYAEVEPTKVELTRAEEYFSARSYLGDKDYNEGKSLKQYGNRVSVYTLARYYGPGYERGHWPTIFGAIVCLQQAFPGAKVFYGSDSTDDGIECTDEYLASIWEHFLGPDGDNYRKGR